MSVWNGVHNHHKKAGMEVEAVDVTAVIDRARFLGIPLRVTVLTVFMMLVDGIDLQTMSFAAPALLQDWGLNRGSLAPVLTSSIFGMAFGSVLLGWLSDRVGRQRVFVLCMLFLTIGSLMSARSSHLS
jgi:MFS transporter, AAHS family, 4-hydroxybenzoate transporter